MRRGIDTSHHNHHNDAAIDWHAVRASGVEWAAIKLTEGATYIDPWAERDLHAAKAAGLETVLYHFARPTHSEPDVEADHFLATVLHVGGADAAALDVEDGRQLGWVALGRWVNRYLTRHAAQLVYWNRDYRHHLASHLPAGTREWVAAPGAHQPPAGAAIWQRAQGHVPGITGDVDLDDVL